MLINPTSALRLARKNGYAIPAFDISNMETLQGVVSACMEMRSPAIIQTTEHAIDYAGISYISSLIKIPAASFDIAMHLDHGKSMGYVRACLSSGYTSVMLDGSHLSLRENIKTTRAAAMLCHRAGAACEGELGRILGKESRAVSEENIYTDPEEAYDFVKKTGIDFLAVAIGTKHGFNKGKVRLRLDILKEIGGRLGMPLVLHGGSQLRRSQLKRCISLGISKVNIDSDLRFAFVEAIKNEMKKNPGGHDIREIIGMSRDAVKRAAMEKIKMLGSSDKA